MNRTIIDIHILQTVPPSNINRDDTGSPKTAVYGGVRRARVSSQAWKRATRQAFQRKLDPSGIGYRTRRIVELLIDEIKDQAPHLGERAQELAVAAFKAVGIEVKSPETAVKKAAKKKPGEDVGSGGDEDAAVERAGYLVFLSRRQIQALGRAAVNAAEAADVVKALKEAKVKELVNRDHSVEISLFGRMVADQTDLNVEAAAQVAHAISVHPVETEFDYFTAVDDMNDGGDTGAGMIGTIEFNSSTLYRYAALDVDQLAGNLGDSVVTRRAVETFADSFVRSMPAGKQNMFANWTLPEAVVVIVRDSQPVNLVGAFEAPIRESRTEGRIKRTADALRDEAKGIEETYAERPIAAWVSRVGADTASLDDLGEKVSLDVLVCNLGELVASRLEAPA